jgi:hypothetical protein
MEERNIGKWGRKETKETCRQFEHRKSDTAWNAVLLPYSTPAHYCCTEEEVDFWGLFCYSFRLNVELLL